MSSLTSEDCAERGEPSRRLSEDKHMNQFYRQLWPELKTYTPKDTWEMALKTSLGVEQAKCLAVLAILAALVCGVLYIVFAFVPPRVSPDAFKSLQKDVHALQKDFAKMNAQLQNVAQYLVMEQMYPCSEQPNPTECELQRLAMFTALGDYVSTIEEVVE
jgi:hypothetical protein